MRLLDGARCAALAGMAALGLTSHCVAGALTVGVSDRSNSPVDAVVITVVPVGSAPPTTVKTAQADAPSAAVMDQRNLAFAPRVIAVAVGSAVDFPNNDSVSHQVYSFSPAKRFQLPLYKGQHHAPITFDRAGLVVLGCNIHDSMVGYIYVTDAPYFGITDAEGILKISALPPGEYRITAWSPYIDDPPASLNIDVSVGAREPTQMKIKLVHDLRSRPEPQPQRAGWEY